MLFAQVILSFLWSVITSRIGQIALSFLVAWVWSGLRTDDYWEAKIARDNAVKEAAYHAEVERQEQAAREIAAAATARAEADAQVQDEMRRQIEAFNQKEPIYVEKKSQGAVAGPSCYIDGNFANVVRQFDAYNRPGKAPRRSR